MLDQLRRKQKVTRTVVSTCCTWGILGLASLAYTLGHWIVVGLTALDSRPAVVVAVALLPSSNRCMGCTATKTRILSHTRILY